MQVCQLQQLLQTFHGTTMGSSNNRSGLLGLTKRPSWFGMGAYFWGGHFSPVRFRMVVDAVAYVVY